LWLGTDKHLHFGNINEEIISKFRCDKFEDQSDSVQQAFLFCMLTLMPSINKTWQRAEVRVHQLLSRNISRSDEALLYWYLLCYSDKWITEYNEETQYQQTHQGNTFPKRQKTTGSHFARIYLCKYQEKKKELKDKWSNPTTGTGWDEAVQLEAKRLHDLDRKEQQGTNNLSELPDPETAPKHSFPGVDFQDYDIEEFEEV
jgi:hypothetical protein